MKILNPISFTLPITGYPGNWTAFVSGMGIFIMNEIWKDIPGYEGRYEVSTLGRMRRLSQEQWRKTPRVDKYRYVIGSTSSKTSQGKYRLMWMGNGRRSSLHRLIAMTFIPNPENKPQVNHIDGNPKNNRIDNLEWCTQSENMIHSCHVLGYKQTKETRLKRAKKQYKKVVDLSDNKIYPSAKEYARVKGIRYNTLIRKINGYEINNLNVKYYNETSH